MAPMPAPNEKLAEINLFQPIQAIKAWLARRGWALVRLGHPNAVYGRVLPGADYRPWFADSDFCKLYEHVRGSTLVDIYRCWELWTVIPQLIGLAPGMILEVGVWRGGTAAILAVAGKRAGMLQPIYLCDTFAGVVKAGPQDGFYKGGEHADASRRQVEELLRSVNITATILEGVFPDDTADQLEHQAVRFIHVDVDYYQSAKDIVTWAWPRLVPGGILVFDDFGFRLCNGIVRLINECYRSDSLILHNLNGHALIVKR